MNKGQLSLPVLEKLLSERLRSLLQEVPWLLNVSVERNPADFNRAYDLLARFKVPRGPEIELWVEIKAEPRPSRFPYAAIEREFDERTIHRVKARVFAAPHISPRMAEVCESHGWSWFDLAGNCRISIPELIHLQHTGNPPIHSPPKPKANLGTREAGRVLRTLLSPLFFGLTWTQRLLQIRCQQEVSLGLVNKVVRYLHDEAFLETLPDGGFRVCDPLKLLFAWRDAYRFDLIERRGYFTLLQGQKLRETLAGLDQSTEGFAAYASFSAADFQAPHVRQPKTWLYVSSRELDRFEEVVEAKSVDSGENLVVLVPFDDSVFHHLQMKADEDTLPWTNAVQTYVDLWHSGGRGKEAAEAILEQQIKPDWRAAGYDL